MDKKDFKSQDPRTGLLMDIQEVRDLGLFIIDRLKRLVMHPLIRSLLPPGAFLDEIALLTAAEAFLRRMSQADYIREVGAAAGYDLELINENIKRFGFSEELAYGDPDAPTPSTPPLDPENEVVKTSAILSEIASKQDKQEEEHVALSPGLEDFLHHLQK